MNKKVILSVFGFISLLGLFAGGNINNALADSASVTSCSNATLYGTVTPNGVPTQAWFEYGTNTSVSISTQVQTFSTTSSFSETLSGLSPNTTYYFRAMAQNQNGKATGQILSFTTPSCQQPTQTCQDPSALNYRGTLPCTYPQQTCQDPSATNYRGSLPCTYPQLCQDPSATNYHGSLPCRYPVQTCQDPSALNYRETGPCTYPTQTCQDPSAINYRGALPCQYPTVQKCQDTNATNYGGNLPCTYPLQTCQDPSALNYRNTLPCTYPNSMCMDPSATNYRGTLPCRYPTTQVCQDTNANNLGQPLPCTYPLQTCQDPSALNYRNTLPCTYPNSTCQDPSAINYHGTLPCKYPTTQVCQDTNANNLGNPLPCTYPLQTCQDPSAINYRNTLPCTYPNATCQDPSALNYRNSLPCKYPTAQVCLDTNATNYGGAQPCTYPLATCQDPSAINYRNTLPCQYPQTTNYICQDPSAINYHGILPCQYPQQILTCGDPSALNYRGILPCQYPQYNNYNICQDSTAINYRGNLPCQYYNNGGGYIPPVNTGVAPSAITTAATQLSNTSAELNSLIFTSGSPTNAWFEWGTTSNLGNTTSQEAVGSVASTTHSQTISGLTTGVTYYFRAVAENSALRNYGNIMSFTMENLGGTVAGTSSTTVIRPTTIINRGGGVQTLVNLTIDGGPQNIAPGESRNYHVAWKNISSETLSKVVLRVILPKSMTFTSATTGTFSTDDNTLTYNIGNLAPGESNDLYLLASANTDITQGQLIVTVANMVYTQPSGVQGSALAYATQNANLNGSVLGANVLGAGFLPTTFLGWLFLLILLLIILLLCRYIYNQFRGPGQSTTVAH